MGARLSYGALSVDLLPPKEFSIRIRPPVVINTTLSGLRETIVVPRVDISIHAAWPTTKINTTTQIPKLHNWFQHASRGGDWAFALDSAKTVNTTLSAGASAGATSVTVTSATGITIGQTYKLINGPYHQLIIVSNVAGTTISFTTTPLNTDFLSGAIFRDQFYFPGVFPGPPDYPIALREAGVDTWPSVLAFGLVLDFMEKVA